MLRRSALSMLVLGAVVAYWQTGEAPDVAAGRHIQDSLKSEANASLSQQAANGTTMEQMLTWCEKTDFTKCLFDIDARMFEISSNHARGGSLSRALIGVKSEPADWVCSPSKVTNT